MRHRPPGRPRAAVLAAFLLSLAATTLVSQAAPPQQPPAAAPQPQDTAAARLRADSVRRDSLRRDSARADTVRMLALRSAIVGVVTRADGAPAGGARVDAGPTLSDAARVRSTVTTADGRYRIDSLPAGIVEVRVTDGDASPVVRPFPVGGRGDVRLPGAPGGAGTFELVLTILFAALYGLGIVFARWNNIAHAVRAMLESQIAALRTRIDIEVEGHAVPDIDAAVKDIAAKETHLLTLSGDARAALQTEIDALSHSLKLARLRCRVAALEQTRPKGWDRLAEYLWWSRGRENATWVAIHEIERQLTAFLAPPEYVESYLRWAEAELRTVGKGPALAMADAIHLALQVPVPADAAGAAAWAKSRKALLGRGVSIIYAERDTGFSTLMEWNNKASWLILTALLIIVVLTAAAGHAILFLAGAAGGYLSRVMRAIKRDDVPLDYGASWTTLFLSPLFGALSGWFGIAIVAFATQPGIELLGDAFKRVRWDEPAGPSALAVAFLLGFSERLFDAVVGAVERHADRSGVTTAPTRPTTPSPAPAGATTATATNPATGTTTTTTTTTNPAGGTTGTSGSTTPSGTTGTTGTTGATSGTTAPSGTTGSTAGTTGTSSTTGSSGSTAASSSSGSTGSTGTGGTTGATQPGGGAAGGGATSGAASGDASGTATPGVGDPVEEGEGGGTKPSPGGEIEPG
jgi:hypothetical protein